MPNIAIIPHETVRIGALSAVIDGFPSVTHKLSTGLGDAPLEDGAVLTDHAVALPERLELTGFVSDLTIRASAASNAWDELRRLHRETEPLEVITPWGVYPEMLIHEVVANQAGRGMRFSMKLEAVLRVGAAVGAIGSSASGAAANRGTEVVRGRVYAR